MTELEVRAESWPIRGSFTISRGSKTSAEVVVVELRRGGRRGRGEAVPYPRYGESRAGVIAAIEALRPQLARGLGREGLQGALPPGAARNALDCAFWDLEAKEAGRTVAELLGRPPLQPVETAFTLSLGEPEAMGREAAANARRPLLKLKLGGLGDLARVEAVRRNAAAARLIVDANEAWSLGDYEALAPALAALGVQLIEQPFPAGQEALLRGLPRPVRLCADESCHDRHSLAALAGLYDLVNVKLDKCGGLTEALALAAAARQQGFGIMVGCMVATSLAMAPAFLLSQEADFVDLDGPLLLAEDRPEGLSADLSRIDPPSTALWG